MRDEPILILCTAPDSEVGARLARGLVEAKLAACVNLVPAIRSIYAFGGEIHDEAEVQLLIKSRRGLYAKVEGWLVAEHPYEVCEVLALPVEGGSRAYLEWLEAGTSSSR